jgi:hypothetical protein
MVILPATLPAATAGSSLLSGRMDWTGCPGDTQRRFLESQDQHFEGVVGLGHRLVRSVPGAVGGNGGCTTAAAEEHGRDEAEFFEAEEKGGGGVAGGAKEGADAADEE